MQTSASAPTSIERRELSSRSTSNPFTHPHHLSATRAPLSSPSLLSALSLSVSVPRASRLPRVSRVPIPLAMLPSSSRSFFQPPSRRSLQSSYPSAELCSAPSIPDADSDLLPPSGALPLTRQPRFQLHSPSPSFSSPVSRSISNHPQSPPSSSSSFSSSSFTFAAAPSSSASALALARLREEIDHFHSGRRPVGSYAGSYGSSEVDAGWRGRSQWMEGLQVQPGYGEAWEEVAVAMSGGSRGGEEWKEQHGQQHYHA